MNSTSKMPGIAAIILTKDEERDLPACLESIRDIATEVYVIDSGSTDATVEIALKAGATVLQHPFENYAKQFNWALDNIPMKAEWVLRIDADERFSHGLTRELTRVMPGLPLAVTGLSVSRRIRFWGREIRFGDMYPVWLLRLWRNGIGRCEDLWMDEYIELSEGHTLRIRGDLLHDIPKSVTEWTAKHNWYATRECTDILSISAGHSVEVDRGFRRRLKHSVYLRLPLFYRAFAYWLYRYIIKLGFLDGKIGLIYHFLHGFWYRFLVDAKIYEASVKAQMPRSPDDAGITKKSS
jgi:glycosyltransferase involved in cell wall biosynthesis